MFVCSDSSDDEQTKNVKMRKMRFFDGREKVLRADEAGGEPSWWSSSDSSGGAVSYSKKKSSIEFLIEELNVGNDWLSRFLRKSCFSEKVFNITLCFTEVTATSSHTQAGNGFWQGFIGLIRPVSLSWAEEEAEEKKKMNRKDRMSRGKKWRAVAPKGREEKEQEERIRSEAAEEEKKERTGGKRTDHHHQQ